MVVQKIKYLTFKDIMVLTLIFFGASIYYSSIGYIELLDNNQVAPEISVNDLASYHITVVQVILLMIAWLYLRWRNFDFSVLNFKVDRYTLPMTLVLVLVAGAIADIYQYLHSFVIPEHYPEIDESYYQRISYTPELIITSLVNGFFEEIFFIGLVFAVQPRSFPKALILSIVVRFLFHTYQGIAGALTVTTLGISFWLFRRKMNVLVPFFIAHAVFDIWGLSALGFFL